MTAALVILATLSAVGLNAWLKHADDRRCEFAEVTHEPLGGK